MNEDFVPFTLSIKLQEKGFNKETTHRYNNKGEICVSLVGEEYPYPCPTIPEVLKWLREEKEIAINVEYVPYVWQFKIFDTSFKNRFNPYGLTLYSNYEEAAVAGIKYVLDNLI